MGPNQDANWCVMRPWMDHVLGTRIPYTGTEREVADLDRAAQKAARRTTQAPALAARS